MMGQALMSDTSSISVYKRLLQVTRRYWWLLCIGLIATIVVSSLDAGITWLLKPIINHGFIDRDHAFIYWLPLVIMLGFLLRSVSSFASTYTISSASRSVVMFFRRQLFAKYLKLPVAHFNSTNSGNFISTLLYNVEQVSQASAEILLIFLRELTYTIGLLVVMLVVSWRLSLVFILVTPLIYFVLRQCTVRIRRLSFNVQDTMADITKVTDQGVRAHREIRLNSAEEREYSKFEQVSKMARHRELKIVVTNALNSSVTQILLGIPVCFILYFALNPNMHITAGAFASVIVAMVSLQRPFKRLVNVNATLQKGIAAAASIFLVLDIEEEKDEGIKSIDVAAAGNIEFKDVSFKYADTQQWALQNINLQIEQGMTVALVGHSGAGKSTLINLLPRFFDVTHGQICFNGSNIESYQLAQLRSLFAAVSQDIVLFDDTIANNIRYGVPDRVVSDADVRQAAEQAYAMEFITQLPLGIDSLVGQDGVMLSGGQRQRIAIARAILRDAPILILDEATSALDSESERYIQQALQQIASTRTTIMIAHRLSTVQAADVIVVLDQGKIVDTGKHTELLRRNTIYQRLCRLQFELPQQAEGKVCESN